MWPERPEESTLLHEECSRCRPGGSSAAGQHERTCRQVRFHITMVTAASVPTLRLREMRLVWMRKTVNVSRCTCNQHVCPTTLTTSSLLMWQPARLCGTHSCCGFKQVRLSTGITGLDSSVHKVNNYVVTARGLAQTATGRVQCYHAQHANGNTEKRGSSGPAQPNTNLTASTNTRLQVSTTICGHLLSFGTKIRAIASQVSSR